jgi:serine/threonine protein kinase
MNLEAQVANPQASPANTGGGKYLYPSGSKPLSGYTIKRGVGRGGFGEVYFAVTDAGKEVALKLIRRNLDVELRGVTHCLNLRHPNLLAIYDVKHDDQDNCWIVMEYVGGASLDEVIEQHPNGLPPDEALSWLRGIAAGVSYLHDHGIVHRDLKPGNIFNDEGVVKLGDYGLSKFISCSRRSGQTESIGTVHYMAPEVANGRYGREIDIYALGIILFEMLTGKVPFEGESIGEVLMKHMTAEPDVSQLAEPYRTTVSRALAKDPDVRFKTVNEMMASLPNIGTIDTEGGPRVAATPSNRHADPAEAQAKPLPKTEAAAPANATDEEPLWHDFKIGAQKVWAYVNNPSVRLMKRAGVAAICVLPILFLTTEIHIALPEFWTLVAVYCAWWAIHKASQAKKAEQAAKAKPVVSASNETITPDFIYDPYVQPQSPQSPNRANFDLSWKRKGAQFRLRENMVKEKSSQQKTTELVGSMLFSAGIASVGSFVALLFQGMSVEPEQFAWLAIVSTLGAWSVLASAKTWEGKSGDAAIRRFVMLLLGMAVGWVAYKLMGGLLVQLNDNKHIGEKGELTHTFFNADGTMKVGAALTYFGVLFGGLRWWRQADPLRSARFNPLVVAFVVGMSIVETIAFRFPMPWGAMVAGIMSVAIQLSSAWQPPSSLGSLSGESRK